MTLILDCITGVSREWWTSCALSPSPKILWCLSAVSLNGHWA